MSVEINNRFLLNARAEMEQALKEFGEKYGLKIRVGNATYSPGVDGNATFKVELVLANRRQHMNNKKGTGPDRDLLLRMGEFEDSCRSISVGGMAADLAD